MDNKEIEKELEESAKNIKVRDFSEVWEEIKGDIEKESLRPKKNRKSVWKWLSAVAASVVICAVAIPISIHFALKDNKTTYFSPLDLDIVSVDETVFYSDLTDAKIECINFSKYVISSYNLCKTEGLKTKGGMVELSEDENNSIYFLNIEFYDNTVLIDEKDYKDYNLSYSTNGAEITYKLKEAQADTLYVYNIKAEYKSVTYLMEYTGMSEDIQPFFDEFFS